VSERISMRSTATHSRLTDLSALTMQPFPIILIGNQIAESVLACRVKFVAAKPRRRLSGVLPVYAEPDQGVCGVDM
jgi:hypothetical protein